MLDKTESVTTENTTSALSHLAFCALAALGLARQDGIAGTPYAENLFLIRWLATAQKQKRFPKSVAVDISWRVPGVHGRAWMLTMNHESIWNVISAPMMGNRATPSAVAMVSLSGSDLWHAHRVM